MLALACLHRGYPQSHPRRLWTLRTPFLPPARPLVNPQAPRCKPHQHWLCAACTGLFHRVIHGGCGLVRPPRLGTHGKGAGGVHGGRAIRWCWRSADEFAGTALQAAPVLALAYMPSACPQGHPRRLWTVRAHAGALLRPLRGALMKSQAPRCSPRRHWLCAISTGVFHRVIHGGCGLTVPVHVANRAPRQQFTQRGRRQLQGAQRCAGVAGRVRVDQQLALQGGWCACDCPSVGVGEHAAYPGERGRDVGWACGHARHAHVLRIKRPITPRAPAKPL
jgi:hypothetical protein